MLIANVQQQITARQLEGRSWKLIEMLKIEHEVRWLMSLRTIFSDDAHVRIHVGPSALLSHTVPGP